MMIRVTAIIGAALAANLSALPERQVLSDDVARSELGRYAAALDPGPKAFSYRFKFPQDARSDRVWGIDVSHYTGEINWNSVGAHQVVFAYAKATEGNKYFDSTFARNWRELANQRQIGRKIFRGAYHFMSALVDPDQQSANFLLATGERQPEDLPPCVDLEWDFEIKGGQDCH